MQALQVVFQSILDMGAAVFLPIIIFIIGLIVGLKPGKAISAGLTLGVALTGINLVISYMSDTVGVAAQSFVENTGVQLTALDMGWAPALGLCWSWKYAFVMFPVQIGINVIMLILGWTKTLNVDMWNVANKIFTAFIVSSVTGSAVAGFVVAIAQIFLELKNGDATKNQIIDTLNYFNADAWHKLAKAIPSASDVINTSSTHIIGMNDFFAGINVSQTPGFHPSIYWLIPILAALFQYLSAKTMKQPELDGNNPAAGMTKSMTVMMPLMSLYFCLVTPAGLGIYWVTSALFQCLQQVIINKYMDNADIDALVAKNKEKAAKKKAKGQKTFMERLMDTSAKADAAKEEIENPSARKTIKQIASINTKKIAGPEGTGAEDYANLDSVDISKLGEIGKKAYLVSQYEKEHGHTRGGKK